MAACSELTLEKPRAWVAAVRSTKRLAKSAVVWPTQLLVPGVPANALGKMNWPNAAGPLKTPIAGVAVEVLVFITDTVLELKFATYPLLPSGVNATPMGPVPTVIGGESTVSFEVFITETVVPIPLSPKFVT